MFKGLILIAQVSLAMSSSAAFAAVTRAKAAELAGHRIGRMVDTNVIEENYVTRLHKLEISTLTGSGPTEPAFRLVASQAPPAAGNAHSVELLLNDAGRALADNETRGQDSANAPDWQSTDPLSLIETALHWVTDSRETAIQPFKTGTASVAIEQVNVGGNIIGRVTITSVSSSKNLEIDIALEREVLGFRLVNP